jgi:hypothetical protein
MTPGLCYNCRSELVEIRGKLVCSSCHMILETCCEGGRCEYPAPEPKPDEDPA